MIVSIHQPQYMPWLPYLDKVDTSDYFVYLDNVQYQKNGVQNRNKIKTAQGPQWLTVPVSRSGLDTKINNVEINGDSYKRNHIKSIKQNYACAPFYSSYIEEIEKIILQNHVTLADLNIALSEWLFEQFQISTTRLKASELDINGSKGDLVLNICEKLNASVYISGQGAKDYQNEQNFIEKNISIKYQKYNSPFYKQCWEKQGFIKDLSSIDLLFNEGSKNSRVIMINGRVSN